MAKKMFLSRQRAVPLSEPPPVGITRDPEIELSPATLELIPDNTDVGISAPTIDLVSEESDNEMPIPT
jgi:hypothetical protein